MKGLYIHSCCGPCLYASWPLLPKVQTNVAVFYNPNIEPPSEWARRADAFLDVCDMLGCHGIVDTVLGDTSFHSSIVAGRCAVCYRARLERAMVDAKNRGFERFTTTLLSSPRQNQPLLRSVLQELESLIGVSVFFFDQAPEEYEARVRDLKNQQVYVQNYCGCFASLVEKERFSLRGLWE
ncbi:hypothetical protein HPY42_04670 [Coprothermobacteraceae bacterium]|nr:hypothetical protein [Coprothermobacteraceae bacterium]